MLNEITNSLGEFKREVMQTPDEKILSLFLEAGIDFVPVNVETADTINK